MNWEAIGAIGEILGAGAVFLTLFYLARQVRESNKLARSSTAKDLMNGFGEINALSIDPSLATALAKTKTDAKDLTPTEEVQLRQFSLRVMNVYLQGETAFKNGNLDEENFALVKRDIFPFLKTYPGMTRFMEKGLEDYPVTKDWEVLRNIQKAVISTQSGKGDPDDAA